MKQNLGLGELMPKFLEFFGIFLSPKKMSIER